jgi:hypothetical protein
MCIVPEEPDKARVFERGFPFVSWVMIPRGRPQSHKTTISFYVCTKHRSVPSLSLFTAPAFTGSPLDQIVNQIRSLA